MTTTVHSIDLIVSNPKVRSGRPTLKGRSIMVEDVVLVMRHQVETPAEAAEWFSISLAEVHAALAYYYQNQAAIDNRIEERIANLEAARAEYIANGGKPLLND